MGSQLGKLEVEVLRWPNVSVHSHRFGGKEFRFRRAEVGHIHPGGVVDIPFPRSIRDALVAEGLAEEHRWVPNSGWTTFRMRSDQDLSHGLWLMRLSYLRYALKAERDPARLFERERERLRLDARFASLLAQFIPAKASIASNEPLTRPDAVVPVARRSP